MNTFVDWLNGELKNRDWTNSKLARRSKASPSNISMILSGQANPGWNFCVKIARAFSISPVKVFRLAGLLPPMPEDTADEEELIYLMRQLAKYDRSNLIIYAKALVEADEQERRTQVVALDGLAGGDNFGDVNKFDGTGPGAGQPGDRGEPEKREECGKTVLGPGQR